MLREPGVDSARGGNRAPRPNRRPTARSSRRVMSGDRVLVASTRRRFTTGPAALLEPLGLGRTCASSARRGSPWSDFDAPLGDFCGGRCSAARGTRSRCSLGRHSVVVGKVSRSRRLRERIHPLADCLVLGEDSRRPPLEAAASRDRKQPCARSLRREVAVGCRQYGPLARRVVSQRPAGLWLSVVARRATLLLWCG